MDFFNTQVYTTSTRRKRLKWARSSNGPESVYGEDYGRPVFIKILNLLYCKLLPLGVVSLTFDFLDRASLVAFSRTQIKMCK